MRTDNSQLENLRIVEETYGIWFEGERLGFLNMENRPRRPTTLRVFGAVGEGKEVTDELDDVGKLERLEVAGDLSPKESAEER